MIISLIDLMMSILTPDAQVHPAPAPPGADTFASALRAALEETAVVPPLDSTAEEAREPVGGDTSELGVAETPPDHVEPDGTVPVPGETRKTVPELPDAAVSRAIHSNGVPFEPYRVAQGVSTAETTSEDAPDTGVVSTRDSRSLENLPVEHLSRTYTTGTESLERRVPLAANPSPVDRISHAVPASGTEPRATVGGPKRVDPGTVIAQPAMRSPTGKVHVEWSSNAVIASHAGPRALGVQGFSRVIEDRPLTAMQRAEPMRTRAGPAAEERVPEESAVKVSTSGKTPEAEASVKASVQKAAQTVLRIDDHPTRLVANKAVRAAALVEKPASTAREPDTPVSQVSRTPNRNEVVTPDSPQRSDSALPRSEIAPQRLDNPTTGALGVEMPKSASAVSRRADVPGGAIPDRWAAPVEGVARTAIHHLRQWVGTGEQTFTVRLIPESLGDLRITITSAGETVEVVLASSNAHVRHALEHQLHSLREALLRDGTEVVRATVVAPGATDNDSQGAFARGGAGQNGAGERHGTASRPFAGYNHGHDQEQHQHERRSWTPRQGRLNVLV